MDSTVSNRPAIGYDPQMTTSDDNGAPAGDNELFQELISYLPARIWYLTSNGRDMWCRRPYSFCFSTSDGAAGFARAMAAELMLTPIGVDAKELVSDDGLAALRMQMITRIFLDPSIDPDSGEVFGKILCLAEMN